MFVTLDGEDPAKKGFGKEWNSVKMECMEMREKK